MEVTRKFTLPHPPEKVFAFLADVDYQKKWVPGLVSVERSDAGPARQGSEMVLHIKEGGKVTPYLTTVDVLKTNQHVKLRMAGWGCGKPVQRDVAPKMVMFAAYELRPIAGGTEVAMTYSCDMSKAGFFMKLLAVLMKPITAMFMQQFKKAIKKHVGSHPGV